MKNTTTFRWSTSGWSGQRRAGELFLLTILMIGIVAPAAMAAQTYFYLPSITGVDSTPGYPGAMRVQPLTINASGITVFKNVDAATPQITFAVGAGAPLGSGSLLFYNSLPVGPPQAILPLTNVLAASQAVTGGPSPFEEDGYSALTPLMFLELPGISGPTNLPGHSGVMQINQFTIRPNLGTFDILKDIDSGSLGIGAAVVSGTPFSDARILCYYSAPTGPPDTTLLFQDVTALSRTPNQFDELDSFSFETIAPTVPLPEPASAYLLGIGLAGLGLVVWRRRRLA